MKHLKLNNRGILKKWDIFLWWEYRRVFYNFVMLFTGLVCTYICCQNYPQITSHDILYNAFVYAVVANLFYTSGSLIELKLRQIGIVQIKGIEISKLLFTMGLLGSIALSFHIAILSKQIPYFRYFIT